MTQQDRTRGEAELLYPRLVRLIQLIDESAAIIYPRRLHRPHLTRLLIFLIGLSGSLASRDLVLATGYEKAQISRGLKGLAEAKLLDRPGLRGAIRLNAAGQALFGDIMVIARERDASLRAGSSDAEIARFLEMTAVLIDQASRLLVVYDPSAGADRPRPSIATPSANDLILPSLRSLMVYIRRSGTATFRREVGLSNIEWRVLSLIAENLPIRLAELIPLASRDKSQVGRTLKRLHAAGLVQRHDEGRVNVALTLTAKGQACYAKIRTIGVQRDACMFSAFAPEERGFYMAVVERLIANAAGLLRREEAVRGERPDEAEPREDAVRAELNELRENNALLKQRLAQALEEIEALRGQTE